MKFLASITPEAIFAFFAFHSWLLQCCCLLYIFVAVTTSAICTDDNIWTTGLSGLSWSYVEVLAGLWCRFFSHPHKLSSFSFAWMEGVELFSAQAVKIVNFLTVLQVCKSNHNFCLLIWFYRWCYSSDEDKSLRPAVFWRAANYWIVAHLLHSAWYLHLQCLELWTFIVIYTYAFCCRLLAII